MSLPHFYHDPNKQEVGLNLNAPAQNFELLSNIQDQKYKIKNLQRLMSFSRPIQWNHSHADPIWLDCPFKGKAVREVVKKQYLIFLFGRKFVAFNIIEGYAKSSEHVRGVHQEYSWHILLNASKKIPAYQIFDKKNYIPFLSSYGFLHGSYPPIDCSRIPALDGGWLVHQKKPSYTVQKVNECKERLSIKKNMSEIYYNTIQNEANMM